MTQYQNASTPGSNDLSLQHGAPSYWLRSDKVELFLTAEGGHLAPVNFKLKHRWVAPYSMAPWEPAEIGDEFPPVLKVLRGDFFCLPFGESKAVPMAHGDPANGHWRLRQRNVRQLELELNMEKPEGRIIKRIGVTAGHRAVYQEHEVSGVQGRFNYGHHAMIQFPQEGKFFVNTSPFIFGQVKPEPFTQPEIGEYSVLKTGAEFEHLGKVPLANGGETSLQKYPNREGFDDLAMVSSEIGDFAWTAVTLDGYVWFSLKDPQSLPSTVFWFSNGGRHQEPWKGLHRYRLGLEEVNSHFNDGLEISRKNLLEQRGVATTGKFNRKTPTQIRIIQGVHPVAKSFGMVQSMTPVDGADEVTIVDDQGRSVTVPVNWRYLKTGVLED